MVSQLCSSLTEQEVRLLLHPWTASQWTAQKPCGVDGLAICSLRCPDKSRPQDMTFAYICYKAML